MFDVKDVFKAQYPEAFKNHPLACKAGVFLLKKVWRQKTFEGFVQRNPALNRVELMTAILKELHIGFSFSAEQKAKIPKTGALIIVSNHSMGIADGIGLISEIYHVRKDVILMQGAVLRNAMGFGENAMEVDNLSGGINIKVYKQVKAHLKKGGVILMFPAGQVAREVEGEIQEGQWSSGFYRFAKATSTPILPMYVRGENSGFFYFLSKYAKPLSMLWVMPELFHQCGNSISVFVGDALPGDYISQQLDAGDSEEAIVAGIRKKSLGLDSD
ncbi:MAG: 1-acyl-sn-glycerol-3-phosphate acyltransferase [Pseudomonadales bacterium]|nr:1-acyl-sn-glycerol-3-phosphate acyltransferase [Pseudomonadales bacterium]